jgi:hypothetical protein
MAGKYRAIQEMSRLSGTESWKFFEDPSLLKCEFCPLNKCADHAEAGDFYCIGYFFNYLFSKEI